MKINEIENPDFLQNLSYAELTELAGEIRTFLIENVSKTGGHFSSNLGMVETTIALHYVFNQKNDKIIFDVGHQGYTHKILTGRAKDFTTLRKKNGLSGFLKYKESIYDVWEAGHSSTSISAAAGFLEAKATGTDIGNVVVLIGDGSIQNGLAFSALNYLGDKKNQKAIIILNDNNMSISRNVGFLSNILDRVRIRKPYQFLRKLTPKFLRNFKRAISSYLHGGNMLASMGFRFFGPIDGHDIKTLIKYFTYAKNSEQSIIIHVKTTKGKGYEFAEADDLGAWHGTAAFDIATGKPLTETPEGQISWSKGIGDLLLTEAKKNSDIIVLSPAMIHGSGLSNFQKELPDQIIDVGIAEEHCIVMASALALTGKIPVVSIYSTFLQRAYDEINHDITRTNAHVIFLVDRAGIVGPDGSTHQGTFDLAFLSHLPNIVITMPKDLNEAAALLHYALYQHQGPFVIRYPRADISVLEVASSVPFGTWEIIRPLADINFICYGPAVSAFQDAIGSRNFGLINARYLKPLDINILRQIGKRKLVVYEEVQRLGGLGALIMDA
ncbi:MAG: 1-deoxy-D-xylulose-5-phosphate synthase, partial [Firmicutes bacterium]|nr:1-deoxy-D-xylulose-5-phosphate synthase [Bacillota bacterium]